MQDIRQRLLATFQVEYRDHVDQIRALLALSANTSGSLAGAQLEEAFRRAHTLKGAARVVELDSVERLAHRLETLFAQVREGTVPLNSELTELVQRALDAVEDCVAGLGDGQASAPFGQVLKAMEQALGIDPEPTPFALAEMPAPIPAFQPLETVRINTQNFDGLLRSAVELLAESQRQGQVTVQLKAVARQIADMESDIGRMLRPGQSPSEISKAISRLHELEGAARSLTKQVNAVCRLQHRSSWTMTRLANQLQHDVWRARMVPAETLIEGYRKMMRDLARDEFKQVEFRATSAGEHADRRVLEALKDPLMHALRNAVSHGIEYPQERVAKGKPAEGLVTLRIDGDSQRLKITVEDDGRGMDMAKISEVAVRKNILSESEAAHCSPRDAARILFAPGFSTSSSITNLSGRGMGLSVVYEAVRRLQGEVDIVPRAGGGMSLQLSVPVSISTHRLLLVKCSGQFFAIPVFWIERLQRVNSKDVGTVEGKPVITLDGQAVSLFALSRLLNLPQGSGDGDKESNVLPIVIVSIKGERAAVAVDAFLQQSEAMIQDLGPAVPRDGKISGGILLEDGSVALVVNPASILENAGRAEIPEFRNAPSPAPRKASSILVVDDSITTRTLEKSILEAHGYRVRIAVDGVEALAELRAEKVDLVISDVQMPRMDGFELLEAMKKDRNLSKIPVIVVTSLERREDQARGLSLGADAYIVKNKFDQGELLATIRQIL